MQNIIILLQLVLALLSNPQTAKNPNTIILVNSAMSLATQAVNAQNSTVQPVSEPGQGIIVNPANSFVQEPILGSSGITFTCPDIADASAWNTFATEYNTPDLEISARDYWLNIYATDAGIINQSDRLDYSNQCRLIIVPSVNGNE